MPIDTGEGLAKDRLNLLEKVERTEASQMWWVVALSGATEGRLVEL